MIVAGVDIPVPFACVAWRDRPALRISDRLRRARPAAHARLICAHTWSGDPPQIRVAGALPSDLARADALVDGWETDARAGNPHSAHYLILPDGTVCQLADPATEVSYHARTLNEHSVGVEIADPKDALGRHRLTDAAITAWGELADALSVALGIQRQYHAYGGRDVPRLVAGGVGCSGACGHRDRGDADDRGPCDPGPEPFLELQRRGWHGSDWGHDEDRAYWRPIQTSVGADPDGDPGSQTLAALARAGYPHGIYALGKG